MDYSISNLQESLAELFVLNEIQNNFTSYEAILSIKRWKFLMRIPGIAERCIREADENIHKNFLTFIPNNQVLINEGFSFQEYKN